jgi:hypothetical protein
VVLSHAAAERGHPPSFGVMDKHEDGLMCAGVEKSEKRGVYSVY